MSIATIDAAIIRFLHRVTVPVSRAAIFIVYFWFGILKVVGQSPANPLVQALFMRTIPYADFGAFIVLFGLFECLIGISFLVPGMERAALPLLIIHWILVILPLFLLPEVTWRQFMVPTLEGQYIIKDLLIIGTVISIVGHLKPISAARHLHDSGPRPDAARKAS